MLFFMYLDVYTIIRTAVIVVVIYGLFLAIYRLFLSPLAKFPGPKLAALTHQYESYYEVYCYYEYIWKIKKLHMKYGTL